MKHSVDILIIGGGINGAAIAAEAAHRGLRVQLCESNDIASGSSSHTCGLLSGGLRGLEKLGWDSVKQALNEQLICYQRAPHLMQARQFILPLAAKIRSARRIKSGLYLYHLLQSKDIQDTLSQHAVTDFQQPLQDDHSNVQRYCDCTVDDSRLTLTTALLAEEFGATISPQHKVTTATRENRYWQVTIENSLSGHQQQLSAKIIINASGDKVDHTLKHILNSRSRCQAKLVRSDQIVIAKPDNIEGHSDGNAYTLQNDDKRLIYVTPYHQHWLLIGSTLHAAEGVDDDEITIDSENELINLYNRYFKKQITKKSIVKHFSRVSAIYDDPCCSGSDKSRDYFIDLDCPDGHSPLLNIFGGHLSTHRLLAEQALDILQDHTLAKRNKELKSIPLPGGRIANSNVDTFHQELLFNYPRLNRDMLHRLAHSYGDIAYTILGTAQTDKDLGHYFGCDLYGAEVRYLCYCEWAHTADDILWRRTKLGLVMSEEQQQNLQTWMEDGFE